MELSESIDNLREIFLQIVNRFNEMEKIPYDIGGDTLLHFSEVHLMAAGSPNTWTNPRCIRTPTGQIVDSGGR